MERVRWGILGAANIALNKTIPGMEKSALCEVVAVASAGTGQRAAVMAQRFSIPRRYTTYGELLADADVEAVYIPLPNSMHFEWARKAALAGKHVLCEKPLTLSARQTRELVVEFRARSLVLAEAFMYRHNPRVRRAKALLDAGAIGETHLVKASFNFLLADRGNIRLSKHLGGGALYDIGCYCVNVSRLFMGCEPTSVGAQLWSRKGVEVDDEGEACLEFPGGRRALIDFSFNSPWQERLEVQGSRGLLVLGAPFTSRGMKPEIVITSQEEGTWEPSFRVEDFAQSDDYLNQADSFSRRIRHLESEIESPVPTSDAIGNSRTLDAIFKSAANGKRVTIG